MGRHNRSGVLLVAAAVAINACALLAAVLFLASSRSSYEAQAAASTRTISRILQQSIASEVGRIDLTLDGTVDELERELRSGRAANGSEMARFLRRQRARLMPGSTIRATDATGHVIVGTGVGATTTASWATRDFFRGLRDQRGHGVWVTDPIIGAMSHSAIIAFVRRYDDPQGRFAGVVAVAVPLTHFAKLLGKASVGPHGIVLLRDSTNAVIVRVPPSSNPNEQVGRRQFSARLHEAIASGRSPVTFGAAHTGDGIRRIGTYRRLSSVPFSLIVGRAQTDFLAPWRRQFAWIVGLLAAFVGVTSFGTRRLWREMQLSARAELWTQALLNNASDGVHVLGPDGKLVYASDEFCSMLGYRRDELIGRHVSTWDVGIPADELAAAVSRQLDSPARAQFETRHRRKDGSEFPAEVSGKGFEILGTRLLFNLSRDITQRRRVEDDLRIAAVAFETQQGLMVTDENAVIQRVNAACTQITGYAAEELIGRTPAILHSGRQDTAFYAAMREALAARGQWQGEVVNRHKSGAEYTEWLAISAVRDDSGRVIHYLASISDITRQKEAASRIEHMAYFDGLTELPNRVQLQGQAEQALKASRGNGRFGALLMLDLDHFKNVNDTMGHAVGDELLQLAARRMKSVMRHDSIVARFGGDEFSVLLPDLGMDAQDASSRVQHFAERLRAVLSQKYQLGSQSFVCTASIGIALLDPQCAGVDTLMGQADLAMYAAKRGGRNGIRLFEPSMQAQLHASNTLENDLRKAVERGEFVLHYQLQVDRQQRPIGAEALLRWMHPQRGLLLPAEFIAAAEPCGLIGDIGKWALQAACRTLLEWSGKPALRDLRMAVHVSPWQFRGRGFVDGVGDIVSASGIDPERLKLEISESAILQDIDGAIEKMQALRALGIDFAVAGFGTGSSSLACLTRLPLYQLKIDRDFVEGLPSQRDAALVTRAIIAMGKAIGLQVLAEGVETREQLDFLLDAGCDAFQGDGIASPAAADAVERSACAGAL